MFVLSDNLFLLEAYKLIAFRVQALRNRLSLDSALNDALTLSRAGAVSKALEPNSPLIVTEGDPSADSAPKRMAPIDAIAPSTDPEEGAPGLVVRAAQVGREK